ncbi:MAG: DnaA/Hda family protein [Acetobacteraceae bacterium]|jgi:chromosomal replication initiation ATPase DnaA|nr:DnaA/Hda family protein [Acetobacteraceae bacterium]
MAEDARRGGQLPLPFSPARSFAAADFVAGEANAEARAWIARWPDWPQRRLALWGPAGCGKSHLAAIWRDTTGATLLDGTALAAMAPEAVPALLPPTGAVLVEDTSGAPQGRPLLHLINAAQEAGASVLLTARQPPSRWDVALPDLRSRLASIAAVAIAAPDEALVKAVLAKLLADRQVSLRPELLSFLALRLPRDFATIHALAAGLDRASLAAGRRITRPLATAALAEAMAATGHAPPPAVGDDDNSVDPGAHYSPR